MGEWRQVEISYLRANRTHCALCGQPLPGRYWVATVAGEEHIFCSPNHEARYGSYWLPRYGAGRSQP